MSAPTGLNDTWYTPADTLAVPIEEQRQQLAEAELFLGLSLTARGAKDEGEDLLARSLDGLRSQRGEDHRLTVRAAAAHGSL